MAIARAVVTEPRLILADEPTGALDTKTAAHIMELLCEINASRGITVLVVTHNPQVSVYCRRKLTMADGEIVEDAPLVPSA